MTSPRKQFIAACRTAVFCTRPRKPTGYECHHAVCTMAEIVDEFILVYDIDINSTKFFKGEFLDSSMKNKFRIFHGKRVEYVVVPREVHEAIHTVSD